MHRRIGPALLPLGTVLTVLGVCALPSTPARGQNGPGPAPAQQTTLPAIDCPATKTAHAAFTRQASSLSGTLVDNAAFAQAANQHAFALEVEQMESSALKAAGAAVVAADANCATLPAFDWVTKGKVTAIRDQLSCGSCWDFAAIAALETSYALRNNEIINASEQYTLDCATAPDGTPAGSCLQSNGGPYHGGPHAVFNWMETHAEATEVEDPYKGKDTTCTPIAAAPYHVLAWDWVRPTQGIAAVADIKKAVCAHGGVVSSVYAANWGKYTCGVWSETTIAANTYDHSIFIVGWDNAHKAWLVKNSWGAQFGQDGFIWVAWDSDNIGTAATWVDAASNKVTPIALSAMHALMVKHSLLPAPDHK